MTRATSWGQMLHNTYLQLIKFRACGPHQMLQPALAPCLVFDCATSQRAFQLGSARAAGDNCPRVCPYVCGSSNCSTRRSSVLLLPVARCDLIRSRRKRCEKYAKQFSHFSHCLQLNKNSICRLFLSLFLSHSLFVYLSLYFAYSLPLSLPLSAFRAYFAQGMRHLVQNAS